MDFSFFDFYQLNKLLIVIAYFTNSKRHISKKILLDICSSQIICARRYNYNKAIKLAYLLNLISKNDDNKIFLSKLGKIFLSFNPKRNYELTNRQKKFLIKNYIFNGIFSSNTKTLFSLFHPDYENGTYVFNMEESSFSKDQKKYLNLLKCLGIIEKMNSLLVVSRIYVKDISKLLSPRLIISSERLKKRLESQKELGNHAENLVLKFEKQRLMKMGCSMQAKLVRKISDLNESAGYDIESFNGNNFNINYDRFIEVKASYGKKIKFYWTRNEYNTAKKLKKNYWIYFVINLSLSDTGPINPIIFHNPASFLTKSDKYSIEPDVFLIRKKGYKIE